MPDFTGWNHGAERGGLLGHGGVVESLLKAACKTDIQDKI
jgi:hypothetical protein